MLCPFFITSVNIKTQVPFFSYSILNNTKHVQRNVILSSSPVKWWKRSFWDSIYTREEEMGNLYILSPKSLPHPTFLFVHVPFYIYSSNTYYGSFIFLWGQFFIDFMKVHPILQSHTYVYACSVCTYLYTLQMSHTISW